MTKSISDVWLHFVFSTKKRTALLHDREIRDRVHGYIAEVCKNMTSPMVTVGGTADHVHILCHLSTEMTVKKLIQIIKQDSSKWIKATWPHLWNFYWQRGYGVFSVSPSQASKVRAYIHNQEAHHRKVNFQTEFVRMLQRSGVAYDEQYLWDD